MGDVDRPPNTLHRVNALDAVSALMAAMRRVNGLRSDSHAAGDLLGELSTSGFYLGVAHQETPSESAP
jgi:hypothetical protein